MGTSSDDGDCDFCGRDFCGGDGLARKVAGGEKDKDAAIQSRNAHRQLAPWLFVFLAGGYTGGILSLVMQQKPLFESPHFWTGSLVLILLLINGVISLSGFFGNKAGLRAVHAYLGSTTLLIMFVHAVLGLNLGISL